MGTALGGGIELGAWYSVFKQCSFLRVFWVLFFWLKKIYPTQLDVGFLTGFRKYTQIIIFSSSDPCKALTNLVWFFFTQTINMVQCLFLSWWYSCFLRTTKKLWHFKCFFFAFACSWFSSEMHYSTCCSLWGRGAASLFGCNFFGLNPCTVIWTRKASSNAELLGNSQ